MQTGVDVPSKSLIDDDLRLLCCCEPLRIKNFPAMCAIEPLLLSVLRQQPRIDTDRLAYPGRPLPILLQIAGRQLTDLNMVIDQKRYEVEPTPLIKLGQHSPP